MKVLLYIVAIVAILTGGWFSYGTMNKFAKLQNDRIELDGQNKNRTKSIVETKKEAKGMEEERDQAQKLLFATEAELELVEGKIKQTNREAASWKTKIEEQDLELGKTQQVIQGIREAFKELGDVQLEQVSDLIEKLKAELRDANDELEELQELTEAANKRVEANNAVIADLTDRITKRAARIAGNKAEGRIVAVNHDWGFAIVSIPSNMPVDENSKLIVKRGTGFIGKLLINAIEGERIIVDVDYQSMAAGMVVQPGDAVVLAKPVTN